MVWTNCWGAGGSLVTALLVLAAGGCDLTEVTDPTAIQDEQLNNPAGAALLRGEALGRFYVVFGSLADRTAEASDEFTVFTSVFAQSFSSLDRRDVAPQQAELWEGVRRSATVAFSRLDRFGPRAHAGEMLALRGQATLLLAANFCPGFAITELDGFTPEVGPPVTTEQAYERALADFDMALPLAADSDRVLNFARVGRAATLLGLGRFSEAAAAAQGVPTSYTWSARYIAGNFGQRNPLVNVAFPWSQAVRSVADREGGSGLDFISAADPRVQVTQYAVAAPHVSGEPLYNPAKYADDGEPIVVASGIQARLIEAEAALAGGEAGWLSILNDLRATQVSPALPPLDDPGTPEARLDLLFRERAFWLFATGHRLADLLRLVRLYDRDPASVFPSGEYHQHGLVYGNATSLPFNASALGTPAGVTGCTGT
jgi:hypothetical protein